MTLYLWLVFSRASGDSGNSPYTVGTCRGLFFVPFPSFPWWIEREAPLPGYQEHVVSPLPLGLDKLQLRSFLLTFLPEYFLKLKETSTQPSRLCTEGSVKPARQRWLCCPYPVPLPGLPFSGRTTLTALRSRESQRREGSSAARPCPAPPGPDGAGRVGNAESLLLCPFGSFSFCLHDTVSWESRRAPPSSSCPAGPSPCHPQYHTFFIMALYCSNQYAQYMLNVY